MVVVLLPLDAVNHARARDLRSCVDDVSERIWCLVGAGTLAATVFCVLAFCVRYCNLFTVCYT